MSQDRQPRVVVYTYRMEVAEAYIKYLVQQSKLQMKPTIALGPDQLYRRLCGARGIVILLLNTYSVPLGCEHYLRYNLAIPVVF